MRGRLVKAMVIAMSEDMDEEKQEGMLARMLKGQAGMDVMGPKMMDGMKKMANMESMREEVMKAVCEPMMEKMKMEVKERITNAVKDKMTEHWNGMGVEMQRDTALAMFGKAAEVRMHMMRPEMMDVMDGMRAGKKKQIVGA